MTNGTDMLAFAIGIADARPLAYLGAAINGAKGFHSWASALGYHSALATDEDEPLTMTGLKSALEAHLRSRPTGVRRLAIYFAGHGIIREAEEGLWLLSDWHKTLRGVAVEPFKRRLMMYDVRQIAIFSDACRDLPADVNAADIIPDGVLDAGPNRRPLRLPVDKFIAAQDGTSAYAVPGATEEDDRCLFTGVLLEGLWGTKEGAFSTRETQKVTSQSLGKFLEVEVPRIAGMYERTLNPQAIPGFGEGEDVYFMAGVGITPPKFPEWPPPGALPSPATATEEAVALGPLRGARAMRGAARRKGVRPHKPRASIAGLREDSQLRKKVQCGITVLGATVIRVWTPEDVVAEELDSPESWKIGARDGGEVTRSVPVLVELSGDRWAAITAMPEFITGLVCDERGVSGLLCRHRVMPSEATFTSVEAIERMETGALRAEDAIGLAIRLREWKHVDPVLGVISAYLYDSIDDVDSIRRMAFAYAANGQRIPYDVALLAEFEGSFEGQELHVTVPAVARREPRTPEEAQHAWTYEETPGIRGRVAGFWPWMRQGWPFVGDPTDAESTLVLSGVRGAARYLTTSRFSTLEREGAMMLAGTLGLASRDHASARTAHKSERRQ